MYGIHSFTSQIIQSTTSIYVQVSFFNNLLNRRNSFLRIFYLNGVVSSAMVKTKKNLTNLSIDHGSLYVWTCKVNVGLPFILIMRRNMIMIYEYIELFV